MSFNALAGWYNTGRVITRRASLSTLTSGTKYALVPDSYGTQVKDYPNWRLKINTIWVNLVTVNTGAAGNQSAIEIWRSTEAVHQFFVMTELNDAAQNAYSDARNIFQRYGIFLMPNEYLEVELTETTGAAVGYVGCQAEIWSYAGDPMASAQNVVPVDNRTLLQRFLAGG